MRYGERVLTDELDPRQRRFDEMIGETVYATALVRRYYSMLESYSPVFSGILVVFEHEQSGVHALRPFKVHLIESVFAAVP